MATVYFFKRYQIGSDEWPRSARPATLQAIARVRGEALMDTAREVDPSELDDDGFLAKAGCERCRKRDRDVLQKVGNVERDEFFGGKAQESRTHYACTVCGTKWVHTVESGVGGHGNNWDPEGIDA